MDFIAYIEGITLESFLAARPQLDKIRLQYGGQIPDELVDPLGVLVAESSYNERAMSYVCGLGGIIGEQSNYANKYIVQSQVMAAYAVEEGGFLRRGFLDPHSSLREFMLKTAIEVVGTEVPDIEFAKRCRDRMGDIYLWRGNVPEVADRFGAMLGAHFASEYLAACQEFPILTKLFETKQPELMAKLRNTQESHFGFSAAAWLEGHPSVELKHAGYAARAAEAAAYGLPNPEVFWASFEVGFEEFCRNDAEYFAGLRTICKGVAA